MTGGLADGGGLGAGERGEAFTPIARRWSTGLELFGVEPVRGGFEPEMRAGGGPAMVFGAFDDAGADGIQFDVAQGGGPMVTVEQAGEEAALPEPAGAALGGVAVGGVEAVDVHHEEGDGVGAVAGGDQVVVVRHQGIRGDPDASLGAVSVEEVEEEVAVSVGGEDGLAVVAALGQMKPVSGWCEAVFAGHDASV